MIGWWLQRPGAVPPPPDQLRDWQRFVADNLEFRLGVAVGAAVAQAWGENAAALQTPTLETWRTTTGLPWFGFWFRELLKWGTLDPFVAFSLAQGLARTREEASALRPSFEAWLASGGLEPTSENLIDPRHYLAWQRSLPRQAEAAEGIRVSTANLTDTDGRRETYDVRPITRDGFVDWIDAAGYSVARSTSTPGMLTTRPERHDFLLTVNPQPVITRAF